jgi:enoyl-CoA hydratase/carnithine racemase
MIPGVAGTQTASRRLGAGWALDLCLTGRWIDAKQALAIGLVAEVVPAAALMRAAGALARRLCRLPRERVAMAKLAVWDGLDLPLDEGLALERRLARRLENLRLEKRVPATPKRARRPGGNGVP